MRFGSRIFSFLLVPALSACGSAVPLDSSSSSSSSNSSSAACSVGQFSATSLPNIGSTGANANVMQVTVNGALCGNTAYQYANEPCVSVTLCSPAQPSNCQTVSNLLLDTGSYGLRVFSSVLTVPLTPIVDGSQNLAECVQYGDGSSQWGLVKYAYVQLGNEPAVNMPIMVIDSTYGTAPSACSTSQSYPDTDPMQAGFNGILGVGLSPTDCGSDCVVHADNGQYFTCNGSNCSCGAKVELAAQVQNPVGMLPTDNNGVLLSLPAVSSTTGVASLTGSLYLGIGTQSNNIPSGVTTYPTDGYGNISTVFSAYSSQSMPSFLDSGSNGLFFPAPSGGLLTDCNVAHGSGWAGTFCPASVQSLSAVNSGASGSSTGSVSFQIGNGYSLLTSPFNVFNDYGASILSASGLGSASFDWGLPFFFGRNVYVGISSASSSLGVGPYFAY